MGLTIDESAETHNSTESIHRSNCSRKQGERTAETRVNRDVRKIDIGRNRGIIGHEISDCWSVKSKDSSRRFERNTGRSDSNRSPEGNQINVAHTRSGEILSLKDSTIGEVHYSVRDTHTWLLESGSTFHVTPNFEWFSNYEAKTSGTVRLGVVKFSTHSAKPSSKENKVVLQIS